MTTVDFHIDPSLPIMPEIRYTLEQFAVNKKINVQNVVFITILFCYRMYFNGYAKKYIYKK